MKFLNLVLVVLLLSNNIIAGQQKKSFELKGTIHGMKDGSSIYLLNKSADTIGITKSKGSTFKFNGYVSGEANYYFLKLDSSISNEFSNALWLVNGKMTLKGKVSEWKKMILLGSEPQDHWLVFKDLQDKNFESKEWLTIRRNFIDNHLSSLFTPYLLSNSSSTEREDIYRKLGEQAKASFYGLEADKAIKQARIGAIFRAAGEIPDFKITMADGKSESIHKLAVQSKYTLIDFWASWCSPCRAAIPKLSEVYKAFHDKGFNIIGVSIDKKKVNWIKALGEDKTPWMHGLDDIDTAGESIFALSGIPGYILVDQNGKIIQTDVSNSSDSQLKLRKKGEKSLHADLYEIIEGLLGEKKGK